MKILAALIMVAYLTGCATINVTQMQTDCEAKTRTFPDMAECLRGAVAASHCSIQDKVTFQKRCLKTAFSDSDIKLYLLKSSQLSERVQKREISDLDARFELQRLFVDLEHQARVRNAAEAQAEAANNANKPRMTDCYSLGNSVSCTTR